jgi:undecaprenyl diphosphate synthase
MPSATKASNVAESLSPSAPSPAVPRHIAIIMDGNGRWAAARGLPRSMGHRAGVDAVRRTVEACIARGVRHLTIYSFSSENWTRPKDEIDFLMGLMKRFIRRDLADLHKNNVRVLIIGERDNIDPEVLALIAEAEELTASNTTLDLVIAFNYGSRGEIAAAAQRLAREAVEGRIAPEDITPEHISERLDTRGLPDPDLLIRTSGEVRVSNFLLWQCAYAEMIFLDVNWPDFSREHLDAAIATYQARDRRYGGLSAPQKIGARDVG